MTYLTCTALSVGHGGTVVAKNISFSVEAGDCMVVVGENGSGKSTLVKTLLGLLPPIAGEISLRGGAGEVGYLPQRGESQSDFPASSWEVALSGRASRLGMRPFYSRADREAVASAMDRTGSLPLRDRPFGSLSGGQQQRVLLARALACNPKLLVLDEPTTGLDPEASRSMWQVIDKLREAETGIIAVTHEVGDALPHATAVLRMADGEAALTYAQDLREKEVLA